MLKYDLTYKLVVFRTFNKQRNDHLKKSLMSHFTKIKTKLYNLETLKKSLSDLNFEWTTGNEEVRGYQGQKHSAELVLKQENKHDIGFKWNGNEYELVTDLMFWAQPSSVDNFLNQINQRYAYNSILQVSEKEGFHFSESESNQDGTVRLVLRRFR